MSRIKRGTISMKRRRKILSLVKGYRFGRSRKERQAREAIYHAHNHAFAHRRRKKGDFRRLWNIRINAAVRPLGLSYSRLIDALNKKSILINRKMLSEIAQERPDTFERIIETVKA
jgi:large subunit ribosomal protein L20